jgi:hypothetical protein
LVSLTHQQADCCTANAVDFLEEMLSRGKAPSLDVLLALSPDEPLLAVKGYEPPLPSGESKPSLPDRESLVETNRGVYIIVHHKWTKRELELRRRFPGLQLDYHFREARKYHAPWGEPLSGWVRELLTTAKMHWSRSVLAYAIYTKGYAKRTGPTVQATNLQFRDWLPGYMDHESWYEGLWGKAGQIVRIACGLSRFAPTKPQRTGR